MAFKSTNEDWEWWCTPLIPALRRQRWVDLCEFAASLVYRVSSRIARTAKAIQKNFISKIKKARKRGLEESEWGSEIA